MSGTLTSLYLSISGESTASLAVGGVTAITFDALMAETFDLDSEVTDYPVENSAPINDSIIPQSPKLSLSGFVTNANVVFLGSLLEGTLIGTARLIAAQNNLFYVYTKRQTCSITTGLATYVDYAMSRCKVQRTGDGHDGYLQLDLEFKKINTVSLQATTVTVSNAASSVAGKAGATQTVASSATTTAAPSAATATQGTTLLAKLLGGA